MAARQAGNDGGAQRIQQMFADALRAHQSGQLAEAERRYRAILAQDARHPDSLHLLGVLCFQRGQHAAAIDLIGQAIAINGSVPFFHNNRGLALAAAGRGDEAAAHYERALALKSDYVEALANFAHLRLIQRRSDEAIALCKRALAHNPDYAEAQLTLGNALREQNRLDEAIACYERTLVLRPDFAEACNNLGNALLETEQLDAAAKQLERAIALRPDFAEAQNSLGVVRDRQGDHARAIECFERALKLTPDDAEVHNNLGAALQNQGAFDDAIAHYERALALRPDYAEARKNLGGALHGRAGERSGRLLRERNSGIAGVRGQYESLPFPARDPAGERYVLYLSPADTLSKVNQYCFGGARDFAKGLRVLVAGCGTGDSVMWLAHQLRDTPSEIVALDLSLASLEICRARAAMRGFGHVRCIHASILDLPQLGLGSFDYITCLGVLHHLADPDAGLAALAGVLAPDGGMAVMVYGRPGREHIYAMQETLRRVTAGVDDRERKLAAARGILSALPPTNAFRQREGWDNIRRGYLGDDTNLWDTLLHEQDRAYTASEVRAFLQSAGLHLQAYGTYKASPASCALQYDLDLYASDAAERERLAALPLAAREDLAEVLDGSLALHTVYATRAAQAALDPTAPQAILSVMSEIGGRALAHLAAPNAEITVVLRSGKAITYRPSPDTQRFLAMVDGKRSNREIAGALAGTDGSRFLEAIASELRLPATLHWLVARVAGGTFWPPLAMEGRFALPLRHEEPTLLVEPGAQLYRAGAS
ncbi:MAG TPA: tetratricopeptide repeat protein [Stellaceae bacterium]|nr:tetratricopeptide repeat protein [Stellaceae bacterium]